MLSYNTQQKNIKSVFISNMGYGTREKFLIDINEFGHIDIENILYKG